jgi:hypothetical protein
MSRTLSLVVLALAVILSSGCGSDDSTGGGANPTPTTASMPVTVEGPAQLQFLISSTELEDEELSPILEQITPQLESDLTNAGLAVSDVEFIAPRSIVVTIEGEDAAAVIPQIEQVIAEGNYQVPLTVTPLPSQ